MRVDRGVDTHVLYMYAWGLGQDTIEAMHRKHLVMIDASPYD